MGTLRHGGGGPFIFRNDVVLQRRGFAPRRMQHGNGREVLRCSGGVARKDSCTACGRTTFTPCRRAHSAIHAPAERRAHQCMAEQVSARCTHCTPAPSTPSSSMRACRLDDDRRPPLCCARQIPAMLASKRSRPHPARAATAHTPIPATRARQTRARARRRLRPGRPPVQPPRPKNMACRCPTNMASAFCRATPWTSFMRVGEGERR